MARKRDWTVKRATLRRDDWGYASCDIEFVSDDMPDGILTAELPRQMERGFGVELLGEPYNGMSVTPTIDGVKRAKLDGHVNQPKLNMVAEIVLKAILDSAPVGVVYERPE